MRARAGRDGGLAFLRSPTRHLLFTGKGGVGKTTVAAAVASALARRGHRVLLTTTDPAAHVVVVDTAPTGHIMLLLDTAGSYHREVLRKLEGGRFTMPLMRLQDPVYTKILLVTLAENTPVSEALALQQDLGRAGITPYVWVVNRSLAAGRSQHPILEQRASLEAAQIARIGRDLAPRVVAIPYRRGAEVAPGLAHASYDHV